MSIWRFVSAWLGLNPGLPQIKEVVDPQHGQEAKNSRGQKVVYDANKPGWVLPRNFSDKEPVKVTKG